MIKVSKKILVFILILTFSSVFLLHINNVKANDKKSTYSVIPLLSGLPVEKGSSYFQLNVETYMHYNIPLLLNNNSNHSVRTQTIIKGSHTDDNGNISYTEKHSPLLSKVIGEHVMKYTLKPHSSKIVNYKLNIPPNVFKGTQLAGIITHFNSSNSKGINNSISYVNGISLTEHKMFSDVKKLSLKKLVYDHKNALYKLKINNNNPLLFQHLKVKIIISGNHSKIYKFNDVNIAPNSNFNFVLPTKNLNANLNDIDIIFNGKIVNKKNNFKFNDDNPYIIKTIYFVTVMISMILFIIILLKGIDKYEKYE